MTFTLEIIVSIPSRGEFLLDVNDLTKFALNMVANDIQSFTSRSVSYSSSLKIPFTPTNDDVYRGLKTANGSPGNIFTQKHTTKVIINGIHVLPGAYTILNRTKGGYELRVISGDAGFFQSISGNLSDLDFDNINGVWSIDNTCNTRTGIVSPLMNYGNFTAGNIHAASYLPSIYLHTLINKIFESNGFTKSGPIFSNKKYLSTVVNYSKDSWAYSDEFVANRVAIGQRTTLQNIGLLQPSISLLDEVTPQVILQQTALNEFSLFTGYTPANSLAVAGDGLFFSKVSVSITYTISGGNADLVLYQPNTGTVVILANNKPAGTYSAAYETADGSEINMQKGYAWHLCFRKVSGTPSASITKHTISFLPIATPNSWLYFEELMPEVAQLDLIRDWAINYGLLFATKNGEVTCTMIEDILTQKVYNVEALSAWLDDGSVPTVPWTLGATPSAFTSLALFNTGWLYNNYPIKSGKTYRFSYTIDFGLNGSNIFFAFLDEAFNVVTTHGVSVSNSGVNAGTKDLTATGNAVYAAIQVQTGGLPNTTIVQLLSIADLNPDLTIEDWTDLRVNNNNDDSDDMDFTTLSFAQKNYLKYSNTDKLANEKLYKASIDINNLNAQPEKTLNTSIFNCSATKSISGVLATYIPIYNGSLVKTVFDNSPGLRISLVRDKATNEPSITFNTSKSAYKVAYFDDSAQLYTLKPSQYILLNYAALSYSAQTGRLVYREYLINEVDIAKFDPAVLVLDNNAKFFKQGTIQYKPGEIVSVQLFKLL